jgi:hypothetical protein
MRRWIWQRWFRARYQSIRDSGRARVPLAPARLLGLSHWPGGYKPGRCSILQTSVTFEINRYGRGNNPWNQVDLPAILLPPPGTCRLLAYLMIISKRTSQLTFWHENANRDSLSTPRELHALLHPSVAAHRCNWEETPALAQLRFQDAWDKPHTFSENRGKLKRRVDAYLTSSRYFIGSRTWGPSSPMGFRIWTGIPLRRYCYHWYIINAAL